MNNLQTKCYIQLSDSCYMLNFCKSSKPSYIVKCCLNVQNKNYTFKKFSPLLSTYNYFLTLVSQEMFFCETIGKEL